MNKKNQKLMPTVTSENSISPTDCILIMGQRGCGKSYLCKNIQSIWPKRVIFDTLGEYSDEGNTCYSFEEFCNKMILLKSSNSLSFILIVQFDPETSLSDTEFNEMIRICYYFGNIQIVIEEVNNHSSPHNLPHWLRNCLLTGRHRNLSLIFTTQRPGELNKTILSQCKHIFIGKMVEGNDINYVKSFLGKDNAIKLINLADRRFIYFNNGNIKEISNDWSKV